MSELSHASEPVSRALARATEQDWKMLRYADDLLPIKKFMEEIPYEITAKLDKRKRLELAMRYVKEREVRAVEYVVKRGSITNSEYQKLTPMARKTATRDLTGLVKKGILNMVGRGKREIKYVLLLRQNDAKMTQKPEGE